MTVDKSILEAKEIVLSKLQLLKGNIIKSENDHIECGFGSLLKSRFLGEFFVSKTTLPKKADINFTDIGNGNTLVTLEVIETDTYVVKIGIVKKYEEALEELSESIMSCLE